MFGLTWQYQTFDFDNDMTTVDETLAPILDANSADLSQFAANNGRFLMYHGWDDPLISPQDGIDYYLRVVAILRPSQSSALLRQR